MSPPARPSIAGSVAAVFRFQLRRLVRGKKLYLALVGAVLVLLAVIVARYAADNVEPINAVNNGIQWGFFRMLCFLVPFLFASGSIGEEVESRTFAYLAARPVGRPAITVGKFAAASALSLGIIVTGLLVMHLACFATEPTAMVEELPSTLRAMGAASLLTLFYCAICTFWGSLIPEAAGIVSALHLAVIEFCFSWVPSFFRFISMSYLAQQLAGLDKGGFFPESVPDISAGVTVAVLVAATLLFLSLAAFVVQVSEYRFSKA